MDENRKKKKKKYKQSVAQNSDFCGITAEKIYSTLVRVGVCN